MVDPRGGRRLGAKPGQFRLRRQCSLLNHLQGDHAIEPEVPGAKHHPHAPLADLFQQFVVAKPTRELARSQQGTGVVFAQWRTRRRTARSSQGPLSGQLGISIFGRTGSQHRRHAAHIPHFAELIGEVGPLPDLAFKVDRTGPPPNLFETLERRPQSIVTIQLSLQNLGSPRAARVTREALQWPPA